MEIEIVRFRLDHPESDFWIRGDFNPSDANGSSLTTTSHQYPLRCQVLTSTSQNSVASNRLVASQPVVAISSTLSLLVKDLIHCPILDVGVHDAVLIDTLIKPRRVKQSKRIIYLWNKTDVQSPKAATSAFVSSFITESYQSVKSCWNLSVTASPTSQTSIYLTNLPAPVPLIRG